MLFRSVSQSRYGLRGGVIKNSDIVHCTANGGVIKDSIWRDGNAKNVVFEGGEWRFGMAWDSSYSRTSIQKGSFKGCELRDCTLDNGVLTDCTVHQSVVSNSFFEKSSCFGCTGSNIYEFYYSKWVNGSYDSDWQNSDWQNSTFDGGTWKDGWFRSGKFRNGTWKDGIKDGGDFESGKFEGGEHHDGSFSGIFDGGDMVS